MKCLRCQTEMKQYPFNQNLKIHGSCYKPSPFAPEEQRSHNPHSVFICDNCGYMEFSTKACETSDI